VRMIMRVLLFIGLVVVSIPVTLGLWLVVHLALAWVCVNHARRFCRRHGLEVCRARWQPACEPSGDRMIKTESTWVQLDCSDAQKERRLVLLLVWPFGVRKLLSDEKYPESYDEEWPCSSA
jgi:hypothetical protein